MKWKCPYFYYKKKFRSVSVSIKKKWKNGFSIVFSKCDLARGDTFFHQKFFLKKPNTSECVQVLVVTWVKLDCVEALLSPPPLDNAALIYSYAFSLHWDPIIRGGGDNRASTQSSFTHVTTNTWAHSEVFGFFRKIF